MSGQFGPLLLFVLALSLASCGDGGGMNATTSSSGGSTTQTSPVSTSGGTTSSGSTSGSATTQHVANPFVGVTQYVNPDYTKEVQALVTQTQASNPTLAAQMATVGGYPTAVWLDRMAAITGGAANGGRMGLAQHITAALSQQVGTQPVVMTIVVYDLPDRDCAALASNGEISIAANPPAQPLSGLDTYEQNYIAPLAKVLQPYATNPNLRFVLIIEPDSVPNLVTNANGSPSPIVNCVAAQSSGVYVQGIQYAITQLHALTNAYLYLDVGQSAWLGWPNNLTPAVAQYLQLVKGTPDGVNSIDGFVSNTANYVPTMEPYLTANETISGQQVMAAPFYQYDPYIGEADYDAALYSAFVGAGFPTTIGFLIDTSRNGWGGPGRPTGPSTSTVLDTFVRATALDKRNARGQWCNQSNAGLGAPPAANPQGYFPQLEAFVWIKPPGESDGTYKTSTAYVGGNADENCNPAHLNALASNTLTGTLPNSPSAGTFFPAQFTQLVQNAYPAVPASVTP
jgi:cellulose 1,4-beta-cellobiosidase